MYCNASVYLYLQGHLLKSSPKHDIDCCGLAIGFRRMFHSWSSSSLQWMEFLISHPYISIDYRPLLMPDRNFYELAFQ